MPKNNVPPFLDDEDEYLEPANQRGGRVKIPHPFHFDDGVPKGKGTRKPPSKRIRRDLDNG